MDKNADFDAKKKERSEARHQSEEAVSLQFPSSGLTPRMDACADYLLFDGEHLFAKGGSRRALHWSIPWGDLMMTMFILFAVLFVWHTAKREVPSVPKRIDPAFQPSNERGMLAKAVNEESDSRQISNLYHMSQEFLKSEHLEGVASASLVEGKAVRIVLTSDVLFASGEAELKESAVEVLEKLGTVVREIPYTITVAGHTDNLPINTKRFPSNWELSAARACVTARFLIDHMFLSPSQVRINAYAEFHPVHPNDNDFDRALNRRVEIYITREGRHGNPGVLPLDLTGPKFYDSSSDLFFFEKYSLLQKESRWIPKKQSECSPVSS